MWCRLPYFSTPCDATAGRGVANTVASIKNLGLAAHRLGRDLVAGNESGNRLYRRYSHPPVSDKDDGNR